MIRYKAKIQKDDDGYTVSFPDLPGCFSYGSTLKEAKVNAVEALDLYLEEANSPKGKYHIIMGGVLRVSHE